MPGETRKRIIEAAARVLARDGYAATSIKDIAAEAGIAPGLVHYYFKTKEDLVTAAVAEGCPPMEWPESDDPTETARLALQQMKQPNDDARLFQALFLEMLGHATRSQPVRRTLLATVHAERAMIEAAALAVIAERGGWSPDEAPAIAAVVWAAGFGISLQRQLDPEFDAGAAIDVLTRLVLR